MKIEEFLTLKVSFKGLVTLTLDRVIRHTIVHHSSYQISSESEKLFADKRTYGRMDILSPI